MDSNGLFLGLGNPTPEYAGTRHNFGFMLADALVALCRDKGDVTPLSGGKGKYEAWRCRIPLSGKQAKSTWIVAKPLTFMNKSGEAAVRLLHYYRIPITSLFVAHDELDLPLGAMRLKLGGGAAGHNGIRSIAELAGTQEFYRLRLGIGKPAGYDVPSFVLGAFSQGEQGLVSDVIQAALTGFFRFCSDGLGKAQQEMHAFHPEKPCSVSLRTM